MTREDILAFLGMYKQEMQLNYGVAVIGLFGSYARQAARDARISASSLNFRPRRKPEKARRSWHRERIEADGA